MVLTARAFVATMFQSSSPFPDAVALTDGGAHGPWLSWHDGPLHVWAAARDARLAQADVPSTVLLGDPAEWKAEAGDRNLVNAVPIHIEMDRHRLSVLTSIVGLPPVFIHRGRDAISIASDIYLLASLPHVRLELDPVSIQQLGQTGHPVDHRTLFRDTELLRGGTRVDLTPGTVNIEDSWQAPAESPLDWPAFIGAQVKAFSEAVERIDVSRSFLSLTAGLDTRAVFAMLARQSRPIPAVTMSGISPSLDARTAATLCRNYGIPHRLVVFDDAFTSKLPKYVADASRLSGGLESFDQAPEVFLYDQLEGEFTARISGNLGNQVGRGGTEGVGTRGASLAVLSPHLRQQEPGSDDQHWLLAKLADGEKTALQFILQREIPFSSVGNFTVGNHFAMQQSPYANRELLETLWRKPASAHATPSSSMLNMRIRDLKHRFLGEPASISFQRTLLRQLGGFAAEYPINLGWRAKGGVSIPGLAMGVATIAGMVVQKTGLDEGVAGPVVRRTGLAALHNFRASNRWLLASLREFTRDTLSSSQLTDVFDRAELQRVLDAHFTRAANHHDTVVFALDVALAHMTFCRR